MNPTQPGGMRRLNACWMIPRRRKCTPPENRRHVTTLRLPSTEAFTCLQMTPTKSSHARFETQAGTKLPTLHKFAISPIFLEFHLHTSPLSYSPRNYYFLHHLPVIPDIISPQSCLEVCSLSLSLYLQEALLTANCQPSTASTTSRRSSPPPLPGNVSS